MHGAGARFGHLVASHLLKYECFIEDTDRREIGSVVLKDEKPAFAVECKTGRVLPFTTFCD